MLDITGNMIIYKKPSSYDHRSFKKVKQTSSIWFNYSHSLEETQNKIQAKFFYHFCHGHKNKNLI